MAKSSYLEKLSDEELIKLIKDRQDTINGGCFSAKDIVEQELAEEVLCARGYTVREHTELTIEKVEKEGD